MKTMRLDKFLSECGLCTRSESKVLLKKGAVTVNGEKILKGETIEVLSFVKDSYNLPYVPGSSLKGMLRTILLENDIFIIYWINTWQYFYLQLFLLSFHRYNSIHYFLLVAI